MKSLKFLSVLLALVILLDTCSKSVIVANFFLNQKQIAKELCVKRNIPRNHCNGKCHLKNELQKEERRESRFPESSFSKYEIVKSDFLLLNQHIAFTELGTIYYFYNARLINQDPSSVFHPPSC